MKAMSPSRLKGVIAAAATPLNPDLSIDAARLVVHCAGLLQRGCDGVNLLGTTGEATYFSVHQRLEAMQAIARSGLPLDRFMVGTGAAALEDAVSLTSAAYGLGFAGALLLPPFYYKAIDPDSLVTYVETVITRVARRDLRLYLYHFPQLTGVPYAIEAVTRLRTAHPEQVLGLKDSSGDIAFSAELARRLEGFDVFPSSEGALTKARQHGFAGCISATVNIAGPLAGAGWRAIDTAEGARLIDAANAIRTALSGVPLIAGIKWTLADMARDPAWNRLSPPLRSLSATEEQALRAALAPTRYTELAGHESAGQKLPKTA
jgi:4-hydroxy-tetrahydrodipicolinate synthase